jgi:hypothetical protein
MSEGLRDLEQFIQTVAENRARLEQAAADAKAAVGELAASRARFEEHSQGLAAAAPRAQAALEVAGGRAAEALRELDAEAEGGAPEEVALLVARVATDEAAEVQQAEQELAARHEQVREQGLEPLRTAADQAEDEARAMHTSVGDTMMAAFKSVTLGMDAVQGQSESLLPALTGQMQRYAELASNVSVAGDGLAARVEDEVLEPLGLDAASAAAAVSAGAAATGTTAGFATAGAGSFAPAAGAPQPLAAGAAFGLPGGAGLIQDGGAYALPTAASLIGEDGASLIGQDGASLIGEDGASMVAAGGGNMVAAGGGNMVAAGAGNMVAAGAGNMVAAGAGNVLPSGAGNMVAAGAGNILPSGAGGLVGNSSNT